MNRVIRKTILALVIPVIIIMIWFYTTTYMVIPKGILPTIPDVGQTFLEMLKSRQLENDIAVSISRVLKGYCISVVLGVTLGSLIGMYRSIKELFVPVITVIRQIPMIAWIPLIILWCGIGETSKVVIIVLVAFFQIIESTPKGYIEVARLYKLGRWKTFIKVYLPHAIPQILVGLRLGLGGSWMAVVAAELIAATSGIGYRMSSARSNMQSNVVIVCMIVVGLVGVLMDRGIGVLFTALTPWIRIENENRKEG